MFDIPYRLKLAITVKQLSFYGWIGRCGVHLNPDEIVIRIKTLVQFTVRRAARVTVGHRRRAQFRNVIAAADSSNGAEFGAMNVA